MDYFSLSNVGLQGAVLGSAFNSVYSKHTMRLAGMRLTESVVLGLPIYFGLSSTGINIPGGAWGTRLVTGGLVYWFFNSDLTSKLVIKADSTETWLLGSLNL